MKFRYKVILSLSLTLFFGVVQSVYKELTFSRFRRPVPYYASKYYAPPPLPESTPKLPFDSQPYVKYSRSGNEIRVGASYIQLKGDWYDGLILIPSFKVNGKWLKPPETVRFKFISYITDKTIQSMNALRIVGDGKLVFNGPLEIESRSEATRLNPTWSEVTNVDIPYLAFERLCQSKRVEISISGFGGVPMTIPDGALLKLKDIKRQVDLRKSVQ